MALSVSKNRRQLNVYIRPLTISDVEKSFELESACFSEEERCSKPSLRYRLTVCPELCHGIFTLSKPHPDTPKGASDFKPQEILIGQILATKISSKTVTDASMSIPSHLLPRFEQETVPSLKEWLSSNPTPTEPADDNSPGHNELGDTIAMHSLCVSETYRKQGFATILFKDYLSRMKDAGCAKRIAILSKSDLVPMYNKFGFKKLGESNSKHGEGGWIDMSVDLDTLPPPKGFRGR